MMWWLKQLFAMLASHMAASQILAVPFMFQPLNKCAWQAAEDGPGPWASITHRGDPAGILRLLAFGMAKSPPCGHWESKRAVGKSLHVSHSLCDIAFQTYT